MPDGALPGIVTGRGKPCLAGLDRQTNAGDSTPAFVCTCGSRQAMLHNIMLVYPA